MHLSHSLLHFILLLTHRPPCSADACSSSTAASRSVLQPTLTLPLPLLLMTLLLR